MNLKTKLFFPGSRKVGWTNLSLTWEKSNKYENTFIDFWKKSGTRQSWWPSREISGMVSWWWNVTPIFLSYFGSMINIPAGELNIFTIYRLFHTRIYHQVRWQRTWTAQQTSPKEVLDFDKDSNLMVKQHQEMSWGAEGLSLRAGTLRLAIFGWKKGTFPSLRLEHFHHYFDLTSLVTTQNATFYLPWIRNLSPLCTSFWAQNRYRLAKIRHF